MKNLDSYDTNIVRYMKEDYLKYSEQLDYAKEKGNTKAVNFLEKLVNSLRENIESYEK